ncbi:MAG: hypothetical protein Q4C49_08075 [Bacillota bacterium]|nr:hypothetical protein [Bacillota bacterium]
MYRISGDEFFILCPQISLQEFETKLSQIKSLLLTPTPIASLGSAYGNEEDFYSLWELAEKEMYEEKRKFHDLYPEYSRYPKDTI